MFDIEELIIAVYLGIEERFPRLIQAHPPRARGFAPSLSDTELITLEIVGELLRYHTDIDIWRYGKRHWHSWFPAIPDRTTFVRHAANLWAYKQLLYQQLLIDLSRWHSYKFKLGKHTAKKRGILWLTHI